MKNRAKQKSAITRPRMYWVPFIVLILLKFAKFLKGKGQVIHICLHAYMYSGVACVHWIFKNTNSPSQIRKVEKAKGQVVKYSKKHSKSHKCHNTQPHLPCFSPEISRTQKLLAGCNRTSGCACFF